MSDGLPERGSVEDFERYGSSKLAGQLTVLLPQPEIDYAVMQGDLYMFSRRDGILLGGTQEKDEFTLEPNLAAKQRILAGHAQLFAPLVGA